MSEALFRKVLGKLEPVDEAGRDVLRGLQNGAIVKVDVKRPRNVQHHRKFYALCNLVYENQEHYGSVEHVVAALKVAIGHCDFIQTPAGMCAIPKSIAFHNMDQTAFNDFYEKCVAVIVTKFLPGVSRADLQEEILQMVA